MDELQLDFSQPKFDLEIAPPLMNTAGSLGFAPHTGSQVNFDLLGAFITNPISWYPRTPARTRTSQSYPGGFLLHTGCPNPGFRTVVKQNAAAWSRSALPIIVHLLVQQVEEVHNMVTRLEGMEGLIGLELGLPPDCEPDQAAAFVEAAVGELPLIVRIPMGRARELARRLVGLPLAAISFSAPRGVVIDTQGSLISGRLFGPAVFPTALAAVQEALETGAMVIASGGVVHKSQADALLAMGAHAVQLDSVFWSLGMLSGWG